MIKMSFPVLKENLKKLKPSEVPIKIDRCTTIIDETKFLKTHIAVVEAYPKVNPPTHENNRARLLIAKPHFDRLMAYYIIKAQL